MKNTSRTLLLFCLSMMSLASLARAQNKACPIPPPSPYKHTAYISTRFDSKAGLMRTVLQHPVALGDEAQPLYFYASFAYGAAGDAKIAPRTQVEIALVSIASAARFAEAHALRLVVDNRELQPLTPERYAAQTDSSNRTIERTRIAIPAVALLDLAGAKRIDVRFGGETYPLTKNHLEALRELASIMRPPSSAPAERDDPGDGEEDPYALPRADR